jgi:hypothetical protein
MLSYHRLLSERFQDERLVGVSADLAIFWEQVATKTHYQRSHAAEAECHQL